MSQSAYFLDAPRQVDCKSARRGSLLLALKYNIGLGERVVVHRGRG